jgi:hypothetical protein
MRAMAVMVLLAATVAACGSLEPPAPTAEAMDDVIAQLVLRDVRVHRLVSGDAGCPNTELHNNAVHMEVAIGAQSSLRDIYLLRWRRAADFDAGRKPFEDCIANYRALNPGRDIQSLEIYPWRAYGPGWTEQLRTILADALAAAGGSAQ